MFEIHHLIDLAEVYARSEAVEEKTVSNRVFGDSKKLTAMRSGGDITVGRFNAAVRWFSANWPEGVDWPNGIPRPEFAKEAA
jgi:hypothetical protein